MNNYEEEYFEDENDLEEEHFGDFVDFWDDTPEQRRYLRLQISYRLQ